MSMSTPKKTVADEQERTAAVRERERNVLIDAGAGTGKTTILVRRLVNMVAPEDGAPAYPIERLAAITFTRRAAGELRLRIRERLLLALSQDISNARRDNLHRALAGLDTAYVGTIHSFADRLLRLRPVEARLSPGYDVVEDEEELIRETFDVLMHAAETGTLAAELAGSGLETVAPEAERALLDALRAGVRAESEERDTYTVFGLDGLVADLIRHRDTPPPATTDFAWDAEEFRVAAEPLISVLTAISGPQRGVGTLHWLSRRLKSLANDPEPTRILRELGYVRGVVSGLKRGEDFEDNRDGWKACKDVGKVGLAALLAPAQRWLANRLANLFPVVVEVYERTKARHRKLDQIDLLLKLRDLLRRDKEARRYYQSLFDHVLVDEFQDTDPLQAEIVLYLTESGAQADSWRDVELAPGKLTVVGDPKQSIYRFRRADVAMYDEVRQVIERSPHHRARLSVNFRSSSSLIDWFNDRFDRILGTPPEPDQLFDPVTGTVFNRSLASHRADTNAKQIHVLPFDGPGRLRVDDYRDLEGEALARYLAWLVEVRKLEIEDPVTRARRPVDYGDIAVLAVATGTLQHLFPELDRANVPHSIRGGTLFLTDPLHRQFLLGLRAVADRDDGIAEAALLRPPFFGVDLLDLVCRRESRTENTQAEGTQAEGTAAVPAVLPSPQGSGDGNENAARAEQAVALIRDLRRRRFERPPGATARDLLEHTALARTVALGENGAQRLERLREICLALEQIAATEGLDYDAATARLRQWVQSPIQLDPPHPVGTNAVHVLTIHQAKGLEFPIVVLWDGCAQMAAPNITSAWRVDRQERGWLLGLYNFSWEEPPGLGLRATERDYANAERHRVVYVAATRARDLLVVPKAGVSNPKYICGQLLDGMDSSAVEELEAYRREKLPEWATAAESHTRADLAYDDSLERAIAASWGASEAKARAPHLCPVAVTGAAIEIRADDGVAPAPVRRSREGRYGPLFGETVHRAIGILLEDETSTPEAAVRRAAEQTGLEENLDEAAADVRRAADALRREDLFRRPGPDLRLEYPLAGTIDGSQLISGYADLVAIEGDRVDVIDFKTNAPPEGPIEQSYPEFVRQVTAYAELLRRAGVAKKTFRLGLLFTGDGRIWWAE